MELKMNPQVRSLRAAGRPSPVREQKQEAGSASPRQGQAQEDKVELSPEALEHMRNQQESGRQTEPLSPEEKRQQAQAEKLKAAKQMLDVMRQQSAQMKAGRCAEKVFGQNEKVRPHFPKYRQRPQGALGR